MKQSLASNIDLENRIASIMVFGNCNFVESFVLVYPKLRKSNRREKRLQLSIVTSLKNAGSEREVVEYAISACHIAICACETPNLTTAGRIWGCADSSRQ